MATDGDRPGGAPPPGPKPTDSPPRRFADLPAADQLRAVEIFRPAFERALARRRARQTAAEHVKAA
ncbi:hypothetical protein [Glycomyces paridis]|uniref:Uncharacterized protein n=1 Tax=Glycomyces paridis TaxID=2126555 RepID=A0A4S8P6R7_9ACTN|nr:hypothetical protein [Glycomyces paridis]THV25967.1 hypothetical protein E9998_19735 [Glycomyces paridis]